MSKPRAIQGTGTARASNEAVREVIASKVVWCLACEKADELAFLLVHFNAYIYDETTALNFLVWQAGHRYALPPAGSVASDDPLQLSPDSRYLESQFDAMERANELPPTFLRFRDEYSRLTKNIAQQAFSKRTTAALVWHVAEYLFEMATQVAMHEALHRPGPECFQAHPAYAVYLPGDDPAYAVSVLMRGYATRMDRHSAVDWADQIQRGDEVKEPETRGAKRNEDLPEDDPTRLYRRQIATRVKRLRAEGYKWPAVLGQLAKTGDHVSDRTLRDWIKDLDNGKL